MMSPSEPGATRPVPVTCIADRRFPVTADGRTVQMPLSATADLPASHPTVARLVVMINGTLRNADVYFASTVAAAEAAGTGANDALIVAPQFLATPDAETYSLDADVPYWTPEGWKIGDRAVHPERGPSSYEVADAIIGAVLDRDRFPALRTVVVAGHSAGGQFVHRYMAFNRVHAMLRRAGVAVRYIVSNPSSYLYFDDRRLTGDGALAPYPRERCADFNRYRYGLEEPNEYGRGALTAFGGAEAMAREYGRRDVAYLLGEADSDPTSDSLDKACGAMAQGATRLERGQRYFRYVQALLGPEVLGTHSLHIVPGVGHDHRAMFMAPSGLALLFGDAAAKARPARGEISTAVRHNPARRTRGGGSMVYELRVYRCMPGRKADVLARFRDHTMGFFKKHGIHVVGFWETVVGEVDELVYITRYETWEDRDKRWGAFQADPGWQAARTRSHERGMIVESIRTALLQATDFSPAV